jgi:hypothetical protein
VRNQNPNNNNYYYYKQQQQQQQQQQPTNQPTNNYKAKLKCKKSDLSPSPLPYVVAHPLTLRLVCSAVAAIHSAKGRAPIAANLRQCSC